MELEGYINEENENCDRGSKKISLKSLSPRIASYLLVTSRTPLTEQAKERVTRDVNRTALKLVYGTRSASTEQRIPEEVLNGNRKTA